MNNSRGYKMLQASLGCQSTKIANQNKIKTANNKETAQRDKDIVSKNLLKTKHKHEDASAKCVKRSLRFDDDDSHSLNNANILVKVSTLSVLFCILDGINFCLAR
jgi:hypothetical protein